MSFISLSAFLSGTTPNIILASGSTESAITAAASCISASARSDPAVMLNKTPVAPVISISSNG